VRADLEVDWVGKGRSIRLNGKSTTGARYLEHLPVVCWSAGDMKVIEGGPKDRRRFLDQGVVGCQPAAVEVLSRFRRSLEQKRELLRHGAHTLEAWNQLLAEAAAELIGRRSIFIESLSSCLQAIIDSTDLDIPQLQLEYRPSPSLLEFSPESLFDSFSAVAPREIEERRVLSGPHRDELLITWGGTEISRIASAGEKKLVGILLCAARGRVLSQAGREPIVLLDDVDAELDPNRLQAAWSLFDSAPQIIATTCHEQVRYTLPEARVWPLESGILHDS
jgi:DNA replication and repair protein RecF